MSRASWTDQLPPMSDAINAFPDCADDGIELRDAAIDAARLSVDEVAEQPELVNLRLTNLDVAGFVARGGRAERVLVHAGRLRGVTWANGLLRDVELRDVSTSDLSLRFSTLRRVVFVDCELPGIDLTESELDEVRLERCRMPGAQFHGARVRSVRIEGCDLAGASGVDALAGASIHPDDVLALAPSMALALGLRLESRAE